MAILANRVKIRNNFLGYSQLVLVAVKKFSACGLLIAAICLIYIQEHRSINRISLEIIGAIMQTRDLVYSSIAHEIKSIYTRFRYFSDLEEENLKLKLQIESFLSHKKTENKLRSENMLLREILSVTKDSENNFITARVIGTAMTPFSCSLILQSGEKEGVKINDVVKSKTGLIGKITEISENYSTVMLINDPNSRIPIYVGTSKNRGILAKQGDMLKLIYLEENHDVKTGDVIYTSGDGKIFAKDIPVAIVTKVENQEVIAKTAENFDNIDFVIIECQAER